MKIGYPCIRINSHSLTHSGPDVVTRSGEDFLKKSNGLQFDCMFEIKDKEIIALKALEMGKQFSLL